MVPVLFCATATAVTLCRLPFPLARCTVLHAITQLRNSNTNSVLSLSPQQVSKHAKWYTMPCHTTLHHTTQTLVRLCLYVCCLCLCFRYFTYFFFFFFFVVFVFHRSLLFVFSLTTHTYRGARACTTITFIMALAFLSIFWPFVNTRYFSPCTIDSCLFSFSFSSSFSLSLTY